MDISVIVATEDPKIEEILGKFFKTVWYKIQFVKFRSQILLTMLEKPYDICIMDLVLDEKSNLDMIKIVRHIAPSMPIIVFSEDKSVESVRKLYEEGIFYCAMKPVQIIEIEQVIAGLEKLLKKQRMVE